VQRAGVKFVRTNFPLRLGEREALRGEGKRALINRYYEPKRKFDETLSLARDNSPRDQVANRSRISSEINATAPLMPSSFISVTARDIALQRPGDTNIDKPLDVAPGLLSARKVFGSGIAQGPIFLTDCQRPARTHARTQRCRYHPRVYENVNPDPEGATGARYTRDPASVISYREQLSPRVIPSSSAAFALALRWICNAGMMIEPA